MKSISSLLLATLMILPNIAMAGCKEILAEPILAESIAKIALKRIRHSSKLRSTFESILLSRDLTVSEKRTILNALFSSNTSVKRYPPLVAWIEELMIPLPIRARIKNSGYLSGYSKIRLVGGSPLIEIMDRKPQIFLHQKRVDDESFGYVFHQLALAEFDLYFNKKVELLAQKFPEHIKMEKPGAYDVDRGLYTYLSERYASESEYRLSLNSNGKYTNRIDEISPDHFRSRLANEIREYNPNEFREQDTDLLQSFDGLSLSELLALDHKSLEHNVLNSRNPKGVKEDIFNDDLNLFHEMDELFVEKVHSEFPKLF